MVCALFLIYNVKVECNVPNDLGLLIYSFNEMAQKLYESEKIQNEYEENRKTLVANISHDLKTPITAIQGYIEALLDENIKIQGCKDKYLKTIYHNTVYINKLIDDLFLFSKLDMQKLDFAFESVGIVLLWMILWKNANLTWKKKISSSNISQI